MSIIKVIQKNGSEKEVQAENGWSIMEILRDADIKEIEGVCGGAIACATCHVYVHPDWVSKVNAQSNEKTEEEDDTLDQAFDITDNSRLSCQIRMSDELDGIIVALAGTKINW